MHLRAFQKFTYSKLCLKPAHIIAVLSLLIWGCSAQKNTGLSRGYHNLTAKYNVLFNGSESYKDGLNKIDEEFTDDYSEVLPVFNYKAKEVVTLAGSDMDRTIKKCSKLITLHSITAKPKVKDNKTLSPDERAFFSKKEYNVFVDDAYLLMAKAHFYRHEFSQASDIFRKVINDFKNQSTTYESHIWLARVSIETGQNIEVSDILNKLINDETFPEKLLSDLYLTHADYFLSQKNYPEAISYLEKAVDSEKKKKVLARYQFILAQLYEKTGDLKRASQYYAQVIRLNPPYEMAFNARINRALAYEQGFGAADEIETELMKMLQDDKNLEYQDQIYYALGNLATKEGNERKAVEFYEKSLKSNKGNDRQKIRSYLTLANYFYSIPDYPGAQAYYDSVVSHVEPGYPGYNNLYSKSKSLTRLVNEINTVTFGDSVLYLAKIPTEDLYKKIDAIIADERKKQDEERAEEQEKRLDEQFGQETAMRNARQQSATGSASTQWYFYNDAARNLGFREFKLKWGNRRLEDHWQRSSKAMLNFAQGANDEIEDPEGVTEDSERSAGSMNRDFYLADIPFSDSAALLILNDIEKALYNMGMIYRDELKDLEKANESFKQLIDRFPQSANLLSAYYNMYGIAREQNNTAMMEYYKNLIAGKFPESMYARVLTDPEYFVKIERKEKEVHDYYVQTYALYQSGNYADVVVRCRNASNSYPDNKLTPQFAYLGILANGKSTDQKTFRDSLISIISKYPGSDIAADARNLINYMDRDHPEFREAEEKRISEELYSYSPPAKHLFILALDKQISTNQLVFNIINFNLDNNDSLNLIVEVINLNNRQNLITVKTFRKLEQAVNYMDKVFNSEEIRKDMPDFTPIPFVISERNLATLRQDRSVDRYLKFYNENYK
jgi:tetratricopeptide (TPR) repeat protein